MSDTQDWLDLQEWVVWNGSLGVLDMAALGRVDHRETGREAWLSPPYDMVGPFSLDELEAQGRVAFGACLILSRRKWQEDQVQLRMEAFEQRRAFAARFAPFDEGDEEHREALELPLDGELTAQEINAAFRRLAKKAHPDAGGDPAAYIRLTEARDVLLELVS
jgi:hypothetical protein